MFPPSWEVDRILVARFAQGTRLVLSRAREIAELIPVSAIQVRSSAQHNRRKCSSHRCIARRLAGNTGVGEPNGEKILETRQLW